jgi:predicted permease
LLAETLFLSALGGTSGFLLAQWAVALLFRFQPGTGVTVVLDTSPDLRVFLFTLAAVGLAGLLFGLIPALAVVRSEIHPGLKSGFVRKGRLGLRVGGGLVALQMAVSIVLLTGSGLFLHSLLRARDADLGFRPEGAVSLWVHLGRSSVPSAEWGAVKEEIARRAASAPGVRVLGVANALPLLDRNGEYVTIPGVEPPPGREHHWVTHYMVDDGYLDALGIPLLSGRGIQESDTEGTTRVVLVNQAAVRRYWPGESPIGKEILLASREDRYRVVGVVGDVKVEWFGDPFEPALYFSMAQRPTPNLFLVARGSAGAENLLVSLRRAVTEVDPDLLIMQAQSLEDRVGVNLYPIRLGAIYLGVFGALALILAAIGLYGVVSLSVSRRIREVGIRMSVGADAGSVMSMVLRGSLRSVVIGGIIGLCLSIGLATLVRSFLFGVEPVDPVTLFAVPLLLGSVAVVAAFVPARRASRVDPVEALRAE